MGGLCFFRCNPLLAATSMHFIRESRAVLHWRSSLLFKSRQEMKPTISAPHGDSPEKRGTDTLMSSNPPVEIFPIAADSAVLVRYRRKLRRTCCHRTRSKR